MLPEYTHPHPPPPPGTAGALVLYVFYLPHLNAAVALPAADEVDRLLRDPAALRHATGCSGRSTPPLPVVGARRPQARRPLP